MSDTLSDEQKSVLAEALQEGWRRYYRLFGEPPHGTLPQIKALVELVHIEDLISDLRKEAPNG